MALPLNYHWRNLFVRKTTTLLTILVIAAVVGTFAWLLGFAAALNSSLAMAADDDKLIVLQRGAISEFNSGLPPDDFNRLTTLTSIASSADGARLISPEVMMQVQLPRLRDGGLTRANVAVRGVTDVAFRVHSNVNCEAATFSTGAPEVIVGRKAAEQFQGLTIGSAIKLGFAGNRDYTVVGYFTADGGPMESEIWGYLPSLQSAYGRTTYSSASIRLSKGSSSADAIKQIEGPAVQLSARTERDYWREQTNNIRTYQFVCWILIAMMSLAAIFSIANTMFATVAGRSREVAMLRTIGFSRGQILLGFVIESVFLALVGGAVGCAGCAAYLALAGGSKDMFGANTFTTLAFDIELTPLVVSIALGGVAAVGVIGAWFPASRAANTPVISALREV